MEALFEVLGVSGYGATAIELGLIAGLVAVIVAAVTWWGGA